MKEFRSFISKETINVNDWTFDTLQTKGFPTIKQFEKELGKNRTPAKQSSVHKPELGYIEMEKQKRELAVEFAANQA